MPAPMAGERTRRFTRSLLRPGQAAELRHSAATAAATASGRLQQRVSAGGGEGRRAAARCEGRGRDGQGRTAPAGWGGGLEGAGMDPGTAPPKPSRAALLSRQPRLVASACSPPLVCALSSLLNGYWKRNAKSSLLK